MKNFILKHEKRIGRITLVILFLALIRTVSEPFRLQHYAETALSFEVLKPYLLAAVLVAVSLFAMVILSFYERHKTIFAGGVLTVAGMLVIKSVYML
jgi:hypothetical protein